MARVSFFFFNKPKKGPKTHPDKVKTCMSYQQRADWNEKAGVEGSIYTHHQHPPCNGQADQKRLEIFRQHTDRVTGPSATPES